MDKQFTLPYEGGLIEENLPGGILHNYEKIWTHVFPDSHPATYEIADTIIAAIKAKKDGLFRLGLTTGVTPATLYRALMFSSSPILLSITLLQKCPCRVFYL